MNKLLGQKISIVSRKVQTTRFAIRGILSIDNSHVKDPDCQIIFVDTPGIFKPKKKLEKLIVENAISEINYHEHISLIFDAKKLKKLDDLKVIFEDININKKNSSLILNKIDLIEKDKLFNITSEIIKIYPFENVFMISAKNGHGCKDLLKFYQNKMPYSPFLYDKSQISTLSERVFSAEITREKLFNLLNSELPYNLHVETIDWRESLKSISIHQNIHVTKNNHKIIIIGKNGENLKKIGIQSRIELEKNFKKKVNLFIFIKVKSNWTKNINNINELGIDLDAKMGR